MLTAQFEDLAEQWVEGRPELRWRSTLGTTPDQGAKASSTSLLEVDPGCALPRHTDSAEETLIVLAGSARVAVDDEASECSAGDLVLIPAHAPHEVANAGTDVLRAVGVYASASVVTVFDYPVMPDGERERPMP